MTSVFESARLRPGLTDGLRALSDDEIVIFVQYDRVVLPLDGYVFWLRTNAIEVAGSLHVAVDKRQNEDETIAINRVVFTTAEDVQAFNAIAVDQMWVGEAAGVRFAFSRSGSRYKAAGLFHYVGDAVYPALESQLINDGCELPTGIIVSNSLPAWLTLKAYNPAWLLAPNPCVTLYPSFAVPDNIRPPYGAVHIAPDSTRAIQAFPHFDRKSSQHQLATDRVKITLYGLTNEASLSFESLVYQFSEDTGAIGIMGIAVVRDEKRTQAELGILAMKKSIEFEISFLQGTIRESAQQLIEKATATIMQPTI
jgi:hypothetical protein